MSRSLAVVRERRDGVKLAFSRSRFAHHRCTALQETESCLELNGRLGRKNGEIKVRRGHCISNRMGIVALCDCRQCIQFCCRTLISYNHLSPCPHHFFSTRFGLVYILLQVETNAVLWRMCCTRCGDIIILLGRILVLALHTFLHCWLHRW